MQKTQLSPSPICEGTTWIEERGEVKNAMVGDVFALICV